MSNSLNQDLLRDALKNYQSFTYHNPTLTRGLLWQKVVGNGAVGQSPHRLLIDTLLDRLAAVDAEAATLLRQRYLELIPIEQLAKQRGVAKPTFYVYHRQALSLLTMVAQQAESELQAELAKRFDDRLPPPAYVEPIGIDESLDALVALLEMPEDAAVVAIDGMGGIGKTTLADSLVRRLMAMGQFTEFAWVSAQHQFLGYDGTIQPQLHRPALTVSQLIDALSDQLLTDAANLPLMTPQQKEAALGERLKERPHLIVIDNLETFEDVERLLPSLRRWAGRSRFVLTSRRQLAAQPAFKRFPVRPLTEPDTLTLVRRLAHNAQLPDVAEADIELLRPIYDLVGGNPLALRLVVGRCVDQGLESVIEGLRRGGGHKIDELYRYIYRQAWDALPEHARIVWLAMPLIHQQGAPLSLIEATSDMQGAELHDAMERLVRLNLVDVRGGLTTRYSIHNLTRTFLLTDIANWRGQ
ncbi:MAG: hypothetical protein H6637_06235 [Ardenticatenales bacterium]|nr:hypothetical protein [Ardenticatenales bacterium]